MNTNKLKAYAPKARLAFMEAVTKRAAFLGLYADRIAEMTIDGDSAVIEGRVFTRQQGQQRAQLVKRIEALGTNNGKFVLKDGFNQFINETAFTWFNRLTAIRYMEVNEYLDHGFRVLSKSEGAQFGEGFEILGSAADVADDLGLNKESIIDMVLDGNKEEELYRAILLGQCHQLSEAMPFMFEALDDATELLLPDNLTKTDSILKDLVNDIPEDNWQEIEVIGWLYQFYISEHKDAVIGKVVKREDIPAATQLFTPNWIVKYLVQNSLGRQWLATYPDSELKEKMEYYITPAEQSDDVIEQLKAITPTSIDPEEIKVLDPACGSGHILVEVYEVLREIYLERGYRQREIPELILTKNIYGLDIDDRAAQMAAFAVMMKAREDDKRIFSRNIKLNIHSIQSTESLNINQLWADLDLDGNKQAGSMGDLFAEPQLDISEVSAENKVYLDLLRYLKELFIDAKNLGSLIEVDSKHREPLAALQKKLIDKAQSSEPTSREASKTLLPIVEQATILARKYDAVVANPPYMGSKYQTPLVKKYLKDNFSGYEKDLFSAFIIRNLQLTREHGELGFMTPFVWMFISSYEQLRAKLIEDEIISTLVQLEYSGFDGATVPICTFTLTKGHISDYKGSYVRLSDFKGAVNQGPKTLEAIKNRDCGWFFDAKSDDFKKIPGSPIAYWLKTRAIDNFVIGKSLANISQAKSGMSSCNSDQYLRHWTEISFDKASFESDAHDSAKQSNAKWFPYNKGGGSRRWFGYNDVLINWENDGSDIKRFVVNNPKDPNTTHWSRRLFNLEFFFQEGLTWSAVTSGNFSCRVVPKGIIPGTGSKSLYNLSSRQQKLLLAFLNSSVAAYYLKLLSPTLNFEAGDVGKLPIIETSEFDLTAVDKLIYISQSDWNSHERSVGFTSLPLIHNESNDSKLSKSYQRYSDYFRQLSEDMFDLEKRNDQLISNIYGLQDQFPATKTLSDITLIRNVKHRYKEKHHDFERSDIVTELISYAIGCISGRFSLDREGLVYAHSGNNGFKELVAEGVYKTFPADDDGIVPLADEEWLFDDDATTRFREFVKTVWGEEQHLSENLDFVAESLCLNAIKPKKGESSMDTIRRYFSTQFYKDHLKTYKKRPIYWLFSSGKDKAFECLVYLHRYNEGTLSRMRTEYVTPLMGKLESRKNILEDSKATASGAELRAIDKELKTIDKKQAELVKFDEELKHLAEMKISIDLDDGVKVNYGKFGNLLADVKAIHGKAPEKIK
ncbi:BREX-1 system adenine-specific DNA-methyltransferase PglX [Photobacterium damselae]|uniref:BREX-1 system adenine-specific DNA-methyltransferase PglX n=1 Tax=Photobacterium damselae TaxID=38293 RepID=UPI0010FEB253|nr:BREX-1 system adenine-specific DNA-methyltransferase PglX [Photobacterium damselae]KAB1507400.1 BREX-1 system adenine-specific DNA-methyltransferase PglX [Photobacterium damselae subsp. damselae]TLS70690.1 BREX-1 system adenine-specific DNA-methyltransferase PglX [Photobacterium damselae subsp. damselae]